MYEYRGIDELYRTTRYVLTIRVVSTRFIGFEFGLGGIRAKRVVHCIRIPAPSESIARGKTKLEASKRVEGSDYGWGVLMRGEKSCK